MSTRDADAKEILLPQVPWEMVERLADLGATQRDMTTVAIAGTARVITLVYRGQLEIERSRIEFILRSLCQTFAAVDFIHLTPGRGSDEAQLLKFTSTFPKVRLVNFVPARTSQVRTGRQTLRRIVADDAGDIMVIGFSSWPYVLGLNCRVWFINGIPEERLLSRDSAAARAIVRTMWAGARSVRSALTVVVSQPMARLVTDRLRTTSVEVIPNAVDLSSYRGSARPTPTYLTYQGGGSPWQGLDRLADVWSALHARDDSLRFRVISRDPRTRVLLKGLPEHVVEFTSAEDADGVAKLLDEARLGFLFRAPTTVNSVSWPMKFGEYLAAGAAVVVTDCGWDLAEVVQRHDAGLVVHWNDPPAKTADAILRYLAKIGDDRPEGVSHAAVSLGAQHWQGMLEVAVLRAVRD